MKVTFAGFECDVVFATYANGQEAIRLVGADDGCPIATASCCIPTVECPSGFTFIKDYSENTGMLKALVDAGIVRDTGERVSSGFVSIPLVKIIKR